MKVFVFCVGGTGIRVMKSALMLLASGIDAQGATIVPILVDPHRGLKERADLQNLIGDYQAVYNRLVTGNGGRLEPARPGFFSTEVKYLSELAGENNDQSEQVAEERSFGDYINLGSLEAEDLNRYLVQTLFSQSNLDSSLSVGFKGSPNVGTVVLGEMISGSDWFNSFCAKCEDGDRVFIISSIFGGTGASGFPLIEKFIRNSRNLPAVRNAIIGAVSVLPYYSLSDPATTNSAIDSSNFFTKTKSALAYYEHGVQPDYLYYVGEQRLNAHYDNDEQKQNDDAHFVELVAATALFDFIRKAERPENPQVLTRSIREDADPLTYSTLGDAYRGEVKAVADLSLLRLLVRILPCERFFPLRKECGFNPDFYNEDAFSRLNMFLEAFDKWYAQLAGNERSFAPLAIDQRHTSNLPLAGMILDFSLDAKDESWYLLEMIRQYNKAAKDLNKPKFRNFMDYAYRAIDSYTSKINR